MSVTYHQILRQVALRINSIVGADAATLEASYIVTPLTTAQFDSADFNFTAQKDALLNAEEMLANAIANTGGHPFRSSLKSTTASIAKGAEVGKADASSQPIIGIYGSVRDTADGTVCTEQPLEVIRRINQETWRTYDLAHYRFDGTRIYHTRSAGVTIDVCVYNRATQSAALDANGPILLPDSLDAAYVSGALSMLIRDDAFSGQAQAFSGYFQQQLQAIQQGLGSVSSKLIPGPSLTPSAT